jgi:hypothetical protein
MTKAATTAIQNRILFESDMSISLTVDCFKRAEFFLLRFHIDPV